MGPEASDDSGLMTGGLIASVMMWDVGCGIDLSIGDGDWSFLPRRRGESDRFLAPADLAPSQRNRLGGHQAERRRSRQ